MHANASAYVWMPLCTPIPIDLIVNTCVDAIIYRYVYIYLYVCTCIDTHIKLYV